MKHGEIPAIWKGMLRPKNRCEKVDEDSDLGWWHCGILPLDILKYYPLYIKDCQNIDYIMWDSPDLIHPNTINIHKQSPFGDGYTTLWWSYWNLSNPNWLKISHCGLSHPGKLCVVVHHMQIAEQCLGSQHKPTTLRNSYDCSLELGLSLTPNLSNLNLIYLIQSKYCKGVFNLCIQSLAARA